MRFPIARAGLRFAAHARRNWLLRHQHPFNFGVHLLGIPVALTGLVLFFFVPWYWALGTVAVGYLLQWVGHRVEGNDVGEFIPVKKALGLRAISVAPRYLAQPPDAAPPP